MYALLAAGRTRSEFIWLRLDIRWLAIRFMWWAVFLLRTHQLYLETPAIIFIPLN